MLRNVKFSVANFQGDRQGRPSIVANQHCLHLRLIENYATFYCTGNAVCSPKVEYALHIPMPLHIFHRRVIPIS